MFRFFILQDFVVPILYTTGSTKYIVHGQWTWSLNLMVVFLSVLLQELKPYSESKAYWPSIYHHEMKIHLMFFIREKNYHNQPSHHDLLVASRPGTVLWFQFLYDSFFWHVTLPTGLVWCYTSWTKMIVKTFINPLYNDFFSLLQKNCQQ